MELNDRGILLWKVTFGEDMPPHDFLNTFQPSASSKGDLNGGIVRTPGVHIFFSFGTSKP